MNVSIAEAKNRLPQLIRAVERGEKVTITRHGKPVVEMNVPAPETRKVIFGGMKDTIKLYPGWNDPIDEDSFLSGDF